MIKTSIKTNIYLFLLMLFAVPAGAQSVQPKAPPATKQKAPAKAQKAQALPPKKNAPLRGKLEKLSCKLGTEDRHARIAVELVGGRLKSLAYYSKWKPRTCSVHIVRDDAFSKWEDTGNTVTVVTLKEEKGAFLVDYGPKSVKFLFREIDRERFCGMNGKITGSLTVTRGSDQCVLEGVMDEPESRDLPKDPPEAAKEPPKEMAKEVAKEATKEPVKEAPKEPAKDLPKDDPPTEQSAVAPKAP